VIRVVSDTNVLVSAMISPSGNEAVLTLAIARGLLTPCFSTEIVSEYEDVLRRRKFGFDADPMMASSSHAPSQRRQNSSSQGTSDIFASLDCGARGWSTRES